MRVWAAQHKTHYKLTNERGDKDYERNNFAGWTLGNCRTAADTVDRPSRQTQSAELKVEMSPGAARTRIVREFVNTGLQI